MGKHVLLADDDQLLASLLNFRLKKGGYEVHHSSNGREVKEYLTKQRPDIIVSDIMMPYFSGIELIDFVRNDLKLSTPIIIISSAGNEQNVLSAFELGANDFITKPVSPTELLVRVARELNK
ncbi:Response regulator receiver domain-containing protein [Maribacter sedimenticola]|uniref:Response regulator receiver domain-containing protein n=1 Tax=Maribacter sedimenticola TaxID=228956 RepID=A0ABY1SGT9_9FLAO|nr:MULTISPECIES: response regulator transcription factor [Maribacter]TVZ14224.1 response regulator receiver domain-containing protein [Maribacter sp. MAR_2009_72]SNR47202.1 Response regulator receiver domain-containing protein [Maribacter sedimenticola]